MKEKVFVTLLTVVTLLGYSQKKALHKHSITYDTVVVEEITNNILLINSNSLNNIFIDDSEFCIKFIGGDKALAKYFAKASNYQLKLNMTILKGKFLRASRSIKKARSKM